MQHGIWLDEHTFFNFEENALDPKKRLGGVRATRKRAEGNVNSYLKFLANPDTVLKKAGKDINAYHDLRTDAHVTSCIQSRKAGVLSLKHEINRDTPDTEQSEFIKRVLDGVDLYRIINDVLETPYYGYSVFEIYWRYESGKIVPKDVVLKPQEWFVFDQHNQLRFRTTDKLDGEPLEYRKFLLAQNNPSYTNPYGEPILSKCFWPVAFKKEGGIKNWVKFAEKYGMPYLYALLSRGADPEERDSVFDELEAFVADGVATFPEGTAVSMLEAARSSSADLYKGLVEFCNAEISKAILSHSAASDSTAGKLGNENSAIGVRSDIINADKRLVEKVVNQLIRWSIELNYYTSEMPKWEMYAEESVDMLRAQRDEVMFKFGVRHSKKYVSEKYGFKDEDFEMAADGAAAPAFEQAGQGANTTTQLATGGQFLIDEVVNKLASGDSSDRTIQPLVELIQNGGSYSDVADRIAALYGDMDTAKFEEILSRAIFAAEMIGRAEAAEEAKR